MNEFFSEYQSLSIYHFGEHHTSIYVFNISKTCINIVNIIIAINIAIARVRITQLGLVASIVGSRQSSVPLRGIGA